MRHKPRPKPKPRPLVWYDDETIDRGVWWWAVEHEGHPAFYLRSLMAGDFAPGETPDERHILKLDGKNPPATNLKCGTCNKKVAGEDLVPIERATGNRRALDVFRTRRHRWPKRSDRAGCWLCGQKKDDPRPRPAKPPHTPSPFEPIDDEPNETKVRGRLVPLCKNCKRHVARRKGEDKWLG